MADLSPEERELRLVETVEFRILAVANNEDKLQSLLKTYLAPLLLKAASEHQSVRTKVFNIYRMLKTFIQPPAVVLPVEALLKQYKDTKSATIKQLDLALIQHSLDRIEVEDRRALVPVALRGLVQDQGQERAAAIVNIVLRLLLEVRIPSRGSKEDDSFRSSLELSNEDARYLAHVIGILFRLRAAPASRTLEQSNPALSSDELGLFSTQGVPHDKIFARLSELKAKLIAFLASGAFTDDERFLPAIFAAAAGDTRVVDTAEEILKRSSISLEDETLVKQLFRAHSSLPAPYRTRILRVLSKSDASKTMTDEIATVLDRDFAPPPPRDDQDLSQLPISALERTKLHTALFGYLSSVAKIGPTLPGFTVSQSLIKSMVSYVESQGWPAPQQISRDEADLRSKAYEIIGMLSRIVQMPVQEKLSLCSWLFRSLSEDTTTEAVLNITAALSGLTTTIPPSIGGTLDDLKRLLLKYMSISDEPPVMRSARYAAVKWANECLPFSDIIGRWIDILAVAGRPDEKNDVIDLGMKGLDPYSFRENDESVVMLPGWQAMVELFFGGTIEPTEEGSLEHAQRGPLFNNFRGPRLRAFPVALDHCKLMMLLSATENPPLRQDWAQDIEKRIATNGTFREQIRAHLRKLDKSHIILYLRSCLEGAALADSPVVEQCLRSFVDVAILTPAEYLAEIADTRAISLDLIKSNNKQVRRLAARAVGVLVAHPANSSDYVKWWEGSLRALFLDAGQSAAATSNAAEGALLAFGYLTAYSVYYGREVSKNAEYPLHFLNGIGVPSGLYRAALETFSELWSVKLAVPPQDGLTFGQTIIQKLSAEAKRGNETAEPAIEALGSLALGLSDDDDIEPSGTSEAGSNSLCQGNLGLILEQLLSMHELKGIELQAAVGKALTTAVARWDSSYVKLRMVVDSRALWSQDGARTVLLNRLIERVLRDCKTTKPSLLKAAGMWLYSLGSCCEHLAPVQSRLREFQIAFMRQLTARDSLVQETASHGLTMVYEQGDPETRSALVKDLVSAFTGSGARLQVGEETELFDPGSLPTGEGSSVTSYKDIVSLANEVGDQKLVYKFMALAANTATWGMRSAFGQFGLGKILSEAETDPKLYVKLYRYRFDPSLSVRRSMENIWKALAKDSNATIDEHFDAIMEDLLANIMGREWRARQASCDAVSDLVQGRPFKQYEKYYEKLWTSALRVLDDVKESVRQTAFRLCQVLSKALVRQLQDGNHASSARAMLQQALPFLLSEKGVESSVQDVKVFATLTVFDVAKHGGEALRPFLSDMVTQLLELLSDLEDSRLNVAYQRVGEDVRDEIDRQRSIIVRQSVFSDAIDNCLRFVDAQVMTQLAPRLESTIKGAIGTNTKIGCARVLTLLASLHAAEMASASDRFMLILEKQVLDKNDEVSRAYAEAAADVFKVASDGAQARFCSKIIGVYMQAEEERRRKKSASAAAALARRCPDHFAAHATELMPFAYLGSHDCDDHISKTFKDVWEQQAGSGHMVLRYVSEITHLAASCIEKAQWSLRHTGAFTVAAMVMDISRASEASGGVSEASLKTIWPVLDATLALKTFAGKQKVLDSFPTFVKESKPLWRKDADLAMKLKKIAIREAKRNNDDYRPHAFRCLWQFARERDDLDMLEEIRQITTPYLDALNDEDKMDIDSKEDAKPDATAAAAKSAVEAIARAYPVPMSNFAATARFIITSLQPYLSSSKFDAVKREIWYTCARDLMEHGIKAAESKTADTNDTQLAPSDDGSATVAALLQSLDIERAEAGVESQRLLRAKAVSATLRAKNRGGFGKFEFAAALDLGKCIKSAIAEERSLEVQKEWELGLKELGHS
ncbi:hypothetical protein HIM_00828 [Hirsutella minnesotensis 3608]|nr:hypothetical protein HIM_00828 [Hirsutella minnesotensis 3608]